MSKRKEFIILDVVRKGMVLREANQYLNAHGLSIGNRPVIPLRTAIWLRIMGWGSEFLPIVIFALTIVLEIILIVRWTI